MTTKYGVSVEQVNSFRRLQLSRKKLRQLMADREEYSVKLQLDEYPVHSLKITDSGVTLIRGFPVQSRYELEITAATSIAVDLSNFSLTLKWPVDPILPQLVVYLQDRAMVMGAYHKIKQIHNGVCETSPIERSPTESPEPPGAPPPSLSNSPEWPEQSQSPRLLAPPPSPSSDNNDNYE